MATPLFIDGFEQFAEETAELLPLAGYGSVALVNTAAGREPGSTALLFRNSSLSRVYPITEDVVSFGAAIKMSRRGARFMSLNSSIEVLSQSSNGVLNMTGEEGQVLPAVERFYYYEIEADWAFGEVRLYVNGKLDVSAPLSGTRPSEIEVRIGGGSLENGEYPAVTVDNFYINDGPRLGPIEVATQLADQDGEPQDWLGSKDETSHAELVGTLPPLPLENFVQADQAGLIDTFGTSTELGRDDTVKGASMIALARVTRRTNQPLLLNSGERQVTTGELTSDFAYYYVPLPSAEGVDASVVAAEPMAIEVGPEPEPEA